MSVADAPADAPAAAALGLRLGFFKLHVADLDRSTRFYMDAFGLEQRARYDFPELSEVVLGMPGDRFSLVLLRHADGRAYDIGDGHGPVGFATRDIEGAVARLVEHGADVVRPVFDIPGARIAFLNDPEGHVLELIQYGRTA